MKKFFTILLILVFGFALTLPIKANDTEDEVYLWTSKNGGVSKVYHYGTGEAVTLPKNYFVYEQEMRGVWVATVYNIAIGKQKDTSDASIEDYKAEFLTILDRMEEFGMNTLFFQIRPSNDAFYKSELNPWSEFLVGPGIDPGWDPLEWMIEETHKRGFDFQCWMNAYRVTTENVLPEKKNASFYTNEELLSFKEKAIAQLADNNFAKLHPEYVVMGEHDTRLILNPSEPAVQDFIVASLKEIIENYDIDGMHFDDYFYLNGSVSSDTTNTNFAGGTTLDSSLTGKNTLNDLANYQEYLNNDPKYAHMERGYTLGDFRRENINVMMRNIRKMVDEYNEENDDCVEFGSKPAAVWRSNSEYCTETYDRCSPEGSNTLAGAYSSYVDLFADTLKWVQEGLVDYVAPQTYYAFENNEAGYADIVDWWVKQVDLVNEERQKEGKKEIKLYIAHGIYKYRDASSEFYNSSEIRNQIVYNKKYTTIKGSALYSYENLYVFTSTAHEKGIGYLKTNWVNNPVYPLSKGKDDSAGLKISDYSIVKDTLDNKVVISFDKVPGSRVYGIYKVEKGAEFDSSDVSTRIKVIYDPYVEGEKMNIRLDDYDENYDYYLKVVSTNGYVSKETTKLDFSLLEEFQSIEIKNVSKLPSEIECSEVNKLSFEVINNSGKDLEYKVMYFEKGVDRKRVLFQGKVTNNIIELDYKAYTYQTTSSSLRIIVTDGDVSCYVDTNTFDIVRQKTKPLIKKIDILSEYDIKEKSEIAINISCLNDDDYFAKVQLVEKNTDKVVSEIEEKLQGTTTYNYQIPSDLTQSEYYLSITLIQNDYEYTQNSNSFKMNDYDYLNGAKIEIDNYHPEKFSSIVMKVHLEKDLQGYIYQINLLDEDEVFICELDMDIINGYDLEYQYTINEISNFKLQLIVKNGDHESSIISEIIEVKTQVTTSSNNKGCSCKKNLGMIMISIISFVGLIFVFRKK